MQIFSFHLVETTPIQTLKSWYRPLNKRQIAGLRHAECMAAMTLGSPIFSPERMRLKHLAVFASWESKDALDEFLMGSSLGRQLSDGWHVRLKFLRRWGRFSQLGSFPKNVENYGPNQPVVAVTLAQLKIPQVFRFIRWGKPVEKLVRDHPSTTLALAATRPPRTFSTFSVWRSQEEMTDMVHGKGSLPAANRHAEAMIERERKDFHHQFITLRFQAISEHGQWAGRSGYIPQLL